MFCRARPFWGRNGFQASSSSLDKHDSASSRLWYHNYQFGIYETRARCNWHIPISVANIFEPFKLFGLAIFPRRLQKLHTFPATPAWIIHLAQYPDYNVRYYNDIHLLVGRSDTAELWDCWSFQLPILMGVDRCRDKMRWLIVDNAVQLRWVQYSTAAKDHMPFQLPCAGKVRYIKIWLYPVISEQPYHSISTPRILVT